MYPRLDAGGIEHRVQPLAEDLRSRVDMADRQPDSPSLFIPTARRHALAEPEIGKQVYGRALLGTYEPISPY
jgi:hypothetical protein